MYENQFSARFNVLTQSQEERVVFPFGRHDITGRGVEILLQSRDGKQTYQNGTEAVSYTHLDVYKRQVHNNLDVNSRNE